MSEGRLLIFDYGGTLVDSKSAFFPILNRVLSENHLPRLSTESEFCGLFRRSFQEGLCERYPRLKSEPGFLRKVVAEFNREREPVERDVRAVPGILSALRMLERRGYRLAIITASSEKAIFGCLETNGIAKYFSKILGLESGATKPEKIRKLLESELVSPEDAYYIGDTAGDVLEAKAAGLKTIGVLWGYHSKEDFKAVSPDFLVDNPEQLMEFFLK